jgi:hypothetical protein
MMVKCPNCNHYGKLPSSKEDRPRRIRCPKCGVKFETQTAEIGQKVLADPETKPNGLLDVAIDLGMPTTPEPDEEPTVIPHFDVGDLKIADSDDEISTRTQKSPARSLYAPAIREPWFYGFLDGWGTFYIVIAVLIFFLAAAVLIFALTLSGRDLVSAIGMALGISLVATFPITCAAVIFLIVDVARNVRELTFITQRNAGS